MTMTNADIEALTRSCAPSNFNELTEVGPLRAHYEMLMRCPAAQRRLREWAEQEQGDPALEQTRRELLPGLLMVQAEFAQTVRQWPEVFRRLPPSNEGPERWEEKPMPELRGMSHRGAPPIEETQHEFAPGLPQLRPHGAPSVRNNRSFETAIFHLDAHDIALACKIDGEHLNVDMFPKVMLSMADSFVQAEEILHANMLDTGRTYRPSIVGDGVPLFSNEHTYGDHTTSKGVYSNIADKGYHLTEAALEEIIEPINMMPVPGGIRSRAQPRKLVVPIARQFTAHRLLKSDYPAPLPVASKFFPEGYCVLDYLTDKLPWYVLTTINGLISIEWKPFKLDLKVEGDALVLEGSQSYGVGYNNPRAIFGIFPESDKRMISWYDITPIVG